MNKHSPAEFSPSNASHAQPISFYSHVPASSGYANIKSVGDGRHVKNKRSLINFRALKNNYFTGQA